MCAISKGEMSKEHPSFECNRQQVVDIYRVGLEALHRLVDQETEMDEKTGRRRDGDKC